MKKKTKSPWTKDKIRMLEINMSEVSIKNILNERARFRDFKSKHGAAKAAALCGVSTVTYWRWETGKTKPKGNDAKRVAELGIVRA